MGYQFHCLLFIGLKEKKRDPFFDRDPELGFAKHYLAVQVWSPDNGLPAAPQHHQANAETKNSESNQNDEDDGEQDSKR